MTGKSVKPHKPNKAAALQLLQQLALEHAQPTPDKSSAESAQTALISQAQATLTDTDQADLNQPAASSLNNVDSDSEAEASLRGGIAANEEDDRQAPENMSQSSGDISSAAVESQRQTQNLSGRPGAKRMHQSFPADVTTDAMHGLQPQRQSIPRPELPQKQSGSISAKLSLAEVIQQQRQRLSGCSLKAGSVPQVELQLTGAQQQQLQQDASEVSDSGQQSNTISINGMKCREFHSSWCPLTHTEGTAQGTTQALQQVHGGQLNQQHLECASLQDPQKLQRQDVLWQQLAECLQDKQCAQKLTLLTVTLLTRM